jgi:DNA polymerase
MRHVRLASPTDFDGWRRAARALRQGDIAPPDVRWSVGDAEDGLFDDAAPPDARPGESFSVPKGFMELARLALLHSDPERFDRLYRLLWRLRAEPHLLEIPTDPQVAQALLMQKNVRQAEHKMHAFLRFRRLDEPSDETQLEDFAAWYEAPHYVIELGAPFFVRRLANARFTIVSDYVSVRWDRAQLLVGPPGSKGDVPADDAQEDLWRTYFANVFNPARLNPQMMRKEMPRRYWRNLPEASLIAPLVRGARAREAAMTQAQPTQPSERALRLAVRTQRNQPVDAGPVEATLEAVAAGVLVCRRCSLWRDATQGVPGEGPRDAALMFVGEQPGDMEDLVGRPFVGPAGQLFDRALAEAGVPRAETFVTNAVKHFKHELRGKRRLHARPDAAEVRACNGWLASERRLVRPKVIVALGATAALAVFHKNRSVLSERGPAGVLDDGALGFLTVHPSYLLRVQDEAAKAREYALFVRDLKAAYALAKGGDGR